MLEMRQAAPLSFSPDGRELLVASNVPGTNQLFAVPLDGSEPRQLTDFEEAVTGQFLPDGRVLVERDSGGNERTQLYVGDEPLVVDPEYKHDTPKAAGSTLAYVTNRRNGVDFDVVARDLSTGGEHTFELGGYLTVAAVSGDGLLVVAERTGERSGDNDLFLCDVETGEVVRLTPHDEPAHYATPCWIGHSLAWATNEGRDTLAIVRDGVVVVESEWDLLCAADKVGRNLLVHENADGYSRLTLYDPSTMEVRGDVALPGRGVVESPVFSPDGTLLAFGFSTATEPFDVYVHEVGEGRTNRLTRSPREVDVASLLPPELHRFESFDGESVPVFLFTPEGEGPFPVVVMVHGGPEAQWLPQWHPNYAPLTQHLLARGYAVAIPNVRGSTGYGRRYEHLDDIRLRLNSVRDLASLHEWLGARPEIDVSRAVVYGRSYGGYMVLAALAFQPELWAAGIEAVGISSFVTFLENTSPYRRAAREREYGSLEHDRDFLEEASPITHVDAIRAPLFIQHGANDPRVPLGESEEIARVLGEKGIRCELVVYADEGHSIAKLGNRIDSFTRAVAFLDEVLGS
ncbi:MAG: S9 family peptidase [Actinobacteria bacterium]|nr:S9 family peptidase [Actinomycetota bacterium]